MNPPRKLIVYGAALPVTTPASPSEGAASERLGRNSKKRICCEKKRDNLHSNRFIEVGTKALRRETDVWGDAAGTAPAVTSVTSLSPSIYFWHYHQARHFGAPSF